MQTYIVRMHTNINTSVGDAVDEYRLSFSFIE